MDGTLRRRRYCLPRRLPLQVRVRIERRLMAAALDVLDESEEMVGNDSDMHHVLDAALAL